MGAAPHTVSSSCEVSASSSTTKMCSPDIELATMGTQSDDIITTQNDDVITQVGDVIGNLDDVSEAWDVPDARMDADDTAAVRPPELSSMDESAGAGAPSSADVFSNMSYFDTNIAQQNKTEGDNARCEDQTATSALTPNDPCKGSLQATLDSGTLDLWKSTPMDDNTTNPWSDDMYGASAASSVDVNPGPVISQWQSCAICLEDFPEHNLLTHRVCGGVLCHACIEVG